jgi:steroid delta-isomerase-like uncharacterized protein
MQPIDVAHRYFDAWNRHDAHDIVSLFAEGGTYADPSTHGPLQGASIGANAAQLWAAFPDLRFEIVSVDQGADGMVAAQWMMLGTNHGSMSSMPPTGKPIELPGADFIRIADDRITSVTGYFDSGLLPRQLGMQVLVQPHTVGPFTFGRAIAVRGERTDRPGAFGITILASADAADQERISEYSRQIAVEMLGMEGFLGWFGAVVGDRMATITAWDSPEHGAQLMKGGAHREAMNVFWAENSVSSGGWTSIWTPERINAMWIRCASCGKMVNSDRLNGVCECGETLPSFGPWW